MEFEGPGREIIKQEEEQQRLPLFRLFLGIFIVKNY